VSQPTRQAASELVTYAARLTRAVRRAADPAVPTALIRTLSILDELGPSTVTALAEADRTSQPTTTATVNALVERGWGVRTPHPDDARSSVVDLTEAGRDQLTTARQQHGDLVAQRLAPYTAEDLAKASALIKHLLENN
jgi:DNA-binding MarR family transcriptional regulator